MEFEKYAIMSGFRSSGHIYVPLSHLRSKGKGSVYTLHCTGSGMLTRYPHCDQCNIKNIALTTVHISRYSIPKSPKNLSDSFDATLSYMLVYIKYQPEFDCGILFLLK